MASDDVKPSKAEIDLLERDVRSGQAEGVHVEERPRIDVPIRIIPDADHDRHRVRRAAEQQGHVLQAARAGEGRHQPGRPLRRR